MRGKYCPCGRKRGPFVFLPVGIHSEVAQTCRSWVDSGCCVKASLDFGGWKFGDEHVVATAAERAGSPKGNKQFLRENKVNVFRA
jgi:hypothetical protein